MEESVGIFGEQSAYIYAVSIVMTIIALAISTRCSLRNLFNIHSFCDLFASHELEQATADDVCSCDVAGSDGDDEAETEVEEIGSPEGKKKIPLRYSDPVDYCEHIQGEIKRVQQSLKLQAVEKSLSEQQLLDEKEIQHKQLLEIFQIMQDQQERFGVGSFDEVQEQMKLYAV